MTIKFTSMDFLALRICCKVTALNGYQIRWRTVFINFFGEINIGSWSRLENSIQANAFTKFLCLKCTGKWVPQSKKLILLAFQMAKKVVLILSCLLRSYKISSLMHQYKGVSHGTFYGPLCLCLTRMQSCRNPLFHFKTTCFFFLC